VADRPGVYALGDFANIPAPDGRSFPQLGSVALQSGQWAARNIEAEIKGKPPKPFRYRSHQPRPVVSGQAPRAMSFELPRLAFGPMG
jgi:NADH dehydrogenase